MRFSETSTTVLLSEQWLTLYWNLWIPINTPICLSLFRFLTMTRAGLWKYWDHSKTYSPSFSQSPEKYFFLLINKLSLLAVTAHCLVKHPIVLTDTSANLWLNKISPMIGCLFKKKCNTMFEYLYKIFTNSSYLFLFCIDGFPYIFQPRLAETLAVTLPWKSLQRI